MQKQKRFEDALYISGGACNPSGIALTIADACTEARAHGQYDVCNDPAIQLMVSQLAYICGIWDGVSEWHKSDFADAWYACTQAQADTQKEVSI